MHTPDPEHQRDPSRPNDSDEAEREKKDHTPTEEELDETIDESFPASDPPANY